MHKVIAVNSIYIAITGAPGSGKTTLINALSDHFNCIPESATAVIEEQRKIGNDKPWDRFIDFHEMIVKKFIGNFHKHRKKGRINFFDRGNLDAIAYLRQKKQKLPEDVEIEHRKLDIKWNRIFILPSIPGVDTDQVERTDTCQNPEENVKYIREEYERSGFGNKIVDVPEGLSIEKRINFILSYLI